MSYRVITMQAKGMIPNHEASMTKLQWSEAFQDLWEAFEKVLGPEATLAAPRPDVDLSPFHAQDHWSRSVIRRSTTVTRRREPTRLT